MSMADISQSTKVTIIQWLYSLFRSVPENEVILRQMDSELGLKTGNCKDNQRKICIFFDIVHQEYCQHVTKTALSST